MSSDGQAVLVTGGARRLGRAMAEGFAAAGRPVVVHYRQSAGDAEAVVASLRARGAAAWAVGGDLAEPGGPEALVEAAAARAGRLGVLVNNASVFEPSRVATLSRDTWRQQLDLHAWAPLVLSRAVAAQAGPGACVVNMLDAALAGIDTAHAAYYLSKRLLLDLTRLLAIELAPAVRVNAIAPGPILPPPGEDEAALAERGQRVPLRRAGRPADIVRAALYLAEADYVTGQVLYVDGGRHLEGDGNHA